MKKCYQCFHEYESEYSVCPYCGYNAEAITAEPQYLQPGTILMERYLIGTAVGAGGFGITYAAWDRILEQKVAIKEYLPGEFSTRMPGNTEVTVYGGEKTEQFRKGRDKFLEESKRLARMQKVPGIVQIYNSFAENGTAYIVMEFLEGETLETRMKREGKIPEREAVDIILPVLQALETVHKEGILHRDIAPNNIFLTNDGEVKLLDFGAARSATGSHSKSLTVLYKEGYTPEEQYRSSGDQGPWTDVYACAATLYRMLTGNVPPGALERRRKDTLKEPSKSGAKVSHGIDVAVMNALNVEANKRTQSAAKFMEELTSGKAKSHYVRTEEKKAGKIPLGVKIGTALLMGAMLVFLALLAGGVFDIQTPAFADMGIPEGKTRVPNVINCDIEEAQKKSEEAGLSFMITEKQFSIEIPENRILSQELKAGEFVEEGTRLEVIVSAGLNSMTVRELEENGIEMVEMPDVQYQDRDEAMAMLMDAGLNVKVEYEITGIVEGGKVTRQSVEAGEPLVSGQHVTLTVEDFAMDWSESEEVEKAVREKLKKKSGDIYASELLQIDHDLRIYISDNSDIFDLKALGNCFNLEEISIVSGQYNGNVQDNKIVTNIQELEKLAMLEDIYFQNVQIDNVEWVSCLEKLKSLRTYHVYINTLYAEKEMHKLKTVTFMASEIGTVENSNIFENAETIYIPENVLQIIPEDEEFGQATYLCVQNISQVSINKIKIFPNITRLVLEYDFLECEEIDLAPISDFRQLTFLGIKFPELSKLNLVNLNSLEQLERLKRLSITTDSLNSGGKEKKIVNELISNLSQIKELSLLMFGTTDLSEIQLENLENLEKVSLTMPDLVSFSDVQGLDNVKEMFLESYASFDFNSIVGLHKLEKLTLKNINNSDYTILKNNESIIDLTLFHTDISDISFLKDMKQLETLSIVACENIQIDDLKDLSQIEHLYISDDMTNLGPDKIDELRKIQ